jgi:hypothetical protein
MVKTDRYTTMLLRLEHEQAERIVVFRHDNRISSETKAFRQLLDLGLEAAAMRQGEKRAA